MAPARVALAAALSLALARGVRVTQDDEVVLAEDELNLDDFLPLCDAGIVASTCRDSLEQGDGAGAVEVGKVKEVLSATRASMDGLWRELGLEAGSTPTCMELCNRVVETIRRTRVCPPRSDVGCYLDGEATVCDVDVRPETLIKETRFGGDLPNYHDTEERDLVVTNDPHAMMGRSSGRGKSRIDYPMLVAVRRTANLFRIYPATLTTVDMEIGEEDEVLESEDLHGESFLEEFSAEELSGGAEGGCRACESFVATSSGGKEWHCYAATICKVSACDSFCGRGGGSYSPGSNTPAVHSFVHSNPNPCKMRLVTSSALFSAHVVCTSSVFNAELTMSGDYRPISFGSTALLSGKDYTIFTGKLASYRGRTLSLAFSSATGRNTWRLTMQVPASDIYSGGGGGYQPVRPSNNGTGHSGTSFQPAWKKKIQQVNVKAIAYLATALERFNRRQTRSAIEKWYGSGAYTSTTLRRRLSQILNSVNAMLGNVEYVMGPNCKSNVYAYVYPKGYSSCSASQVGNTPCQKNDRGQFIFYICDLTLRSDLGVQIETLTHEGSHHATAYTDDVDFEGGRAYGRSTCERLARTNPAKAVENADNFCYYVQDVTDGA